MYAYSNAFVVVNTAWNILLFFNCWANQKSWKIFNFAIRPAIKGEATEIPRCLRIH